MLDRSCSVGYKNRMNRLSTAKRAQVVSALVEGMSVRATCRMTGVAKGTVLKLIADLGEACRDYMDKTLRNLSCRRVQADEIWSFCYAKDKNLPDAMRGKPGVGSIWTWTAIDADTKLVASFHIGTRDAGCAYEFMNDLAGRLRYRVQLTTDGHKAYLNAVDSTIGFHQIDYAMLVKIYGVPADGDHRYSPPECIGQEIIPVAGHPDPKHISTSYVERQNLTMRMGIRRFTRLTNAFSKKIENHAHSVAIHFMHYNFVRIHQTLRCSPAMEAKVTDRLWSIEDMVALLDQAESLPATGTSN
jgi:IS1 family transposase